MKLYVVGIGPGNYEDMTIRAAKALEASQVIAGYTVYVDLVKEHFPGKEFLTTPMTKEIQRCGMALEKAQQGQTTAMICSGDAGIYGMAGLILSMKEEYPDVQVEVIPGVTAASAAGLLPFFAVSKIVILLISTILLS